MKMTVAVRHLAVLLAACAWAASAAADVGKLEPVAPDVQEAIGASPVFVMNAEFTKPPEGSGVTSDKSRMTSLSAGSWKVLVAIDSRQADATEPDVLRFDFSGQGKLVDGNVATFSQDAASMNGYFYGKFGPAVVQAQREGESFPVAVSGYYYKFGADRRFSLLACRASQGQCVFGEKPLAVRLIDGTGNLCVNDKPAAPTSRRQSFTHGDTVLIDTGKGDFSDAGAVLKAYYGQPVHVAGTWYSVAVSNDGKTVSAQPLELAAGQVKVAAKGWSATLVGKGGVFYVNSDGQPINLPADSYEVQECTLYGPATGRAGGRAVAGCVRTGNEPPLAVQAGQTAEWELGTPLQASPAVRVAGRQVHFNLQITDAHGLRVNQLTLANGELPAEPKVSILDAAGQEVYVATLSYG